MFGLETLPLWLLALGFLLILTGLVFRGIRESGAAYWGSVDYFATPALPNGDHAILLVMQGAVLAFFAFIGFEDMYNVAEEVREPERMLPLGPILASCSWW